MAAPNYPYSDVKLIKTLATSISRKVEDFIAQFVNPERHDADAEVVGLLVQPVGLSEQQLVRVHIEFGDNNVGRTAALLVAAERTEYFRKDQIHEALANAEDADRLRENRPRIFMGIEHFVYEDKKNEFREIMKTPSGSWQYPKRPLREPHSRREPRQS